MNTMEDCQPPTLYNAPFTTISHVSLTNINCDGLSYYMAYQMRLILNYNLTIQKSTQKEPDVCQKVHIYAVCPVTHIFGGKGWQEAKTRA